MARIGLVLAGIGTAAMLTACGGSDGEKSDDGFADKSADDIIASAKADMGKLESVRVNGSITSDDERIDLDIQAGSAGNCTGSIGVAGGSTELLGVGGSMWIKPDEDFWRASGGDDADQIITVIGDRWVVVPDEDDSFSSFCDVDELIEEMLGDDDKGDGDKEGEEKEGDSSTYSKDGTTDVDGESTVKIDDTDADGGISSAYVLVDAPNYLVKLEKTEGDDIGKITFSKFDEEFDVKAPAKDEVIDLDELGS